MKRLIALASALLSSCGLAQGGADPLQPFYDFIRAQPGDVAIQVVSVAPDGTQKAALSHNPAQPMPLASSMKVVVLAAYARAVAAGTLRADTPVTLAEWEAFYLPGLDGDAHADSLKALGLPADGYGRAKDPKKTVPLDTLARFMIETSDNAATDALLFRLGKNAVPETIRALGLTGQGDIGPIAGMFVAWDEEGTKYLPLMPSQRRATDWAWGERVRTTPALREPSAVVKRVQGTPLALARQLQNTTPPLGTAGEYAALFGRVLGGQGFKPAELAIMRRHLGWPMRVNPANAEFFNALYAKGGNLGGGVLTNNLAFEFKNGNKVVYSLFLRNVPANLYSPLSSGSENFMVTTLTDPAARKKLSETLNLLRR